MVHYTSLRLGWCSTERLWYSEKEQWYVQIYLSKVVALICNLALVGHLLLVYIDVIEHTENLPTPRATFTRSIRSASCKSFEEIHHLFNERSSQTAIRFDCFANGITDPATIEAEIARAKREDPENYHENGRWALAGTLAKFEPDHFAFMVMDDAVELPCFNSVTFWPNQLRAPFKSNWLAELEQSISKVANETKWKSTARLKSLSEWCSMNVHCVNQATILAFKEYGFLGDMSLPSRL